MLRTVRGLNTVLAMCPHEASTVDLTARRLDSPQIRELPRWRIPCGPRYCRDMAQAGVELLAVIEDFTMNFGHTSMIRDLPYED